MSKTEKNEDNNSKKKNERSLKKDKEKNKIKPQKEESPNFLLINGSFEIKIKDISEDKRFQKELLKIETLYMGSEKIPENKNDFYVKLLNFSKMDPLFSDIEKKNKFILYYWDEYIYGLDLPLSKSADDAIIYFLNIIMNVNFDLYKNNLGLLKKGILHNKNNIRDFFNSVFMFIQNNDQDYFRENFNFLQEIINHKDFFYYKDFLIIYSDIFNNYEFFHDKFNLFDEYLFITPEENLQVQNDQNKEKSNFIIKIRELLILTLDGILSLNNPYSFEMFKYIIQIYLDCHENDIELFFEEEFLIFLSQSIKNNPKIFYETEIITRCLFLSDPTFNEMVKSYSMDYIDKYPELFSLYSDMFLDKINQRYDMMANNDYSVTNLLSKLMNFVHHLALKYENFLVENKQFFCSLLFSEKKVIQDIILRIIFDYLKKFIYNISCLEDILKMNLYTNDPDLARIMGELLKLISYIYLKEDSEEKRVVIAEFITPFLIQIAPNYEIAIITEKFLYNIIEDYPDLVNPFFKILETTIENIQDNKIKSLYNEILIKIINFKINVLKT